MGSLSRILCRISQFFAAFGLVSMTAIVVWQVIARYGFNAAPSWTEQAALLLMLWFVLFAAAVGVREGFHIKLTILQDALGNKPRKMLILICNSIVLIFGAFMAWHGAELAAFTWAHNIPTLNLPRGVAYLPMSIAGVLISFFAFEQCVATVKGVAVPRLWN